MELPRPSTRQPEYGRRLGDVGYWGRYVRSVLDRHGLPVTRIEAPFVGSFPTFLAGDVVVKLFGPAFDGQRSFAVERAMHELLAGHPEIPAPALLGSGRLFDDWPYLITERLAGTAIRDVADPPIGAAARLGAAVAALHRLPVPEAVARRDLLPELRRDAVPRLREFGLPRRLLDQVPAFLETASRERVLVHADLTADHLFVDRAGLVGIIDWGDVIVADPWYELVAVRLDGLRGDDRLFAAFLDGYGWARDDGFARRSLQGVLEFQFDALGAVRERVNRAATLDELAQRVFRRPCRAG